MSYSHRGDELYQDSPSENLFRHSAPISTENQEERNRLRSDIKASKKASAKLGQLIELAEAELTECQDIAETVLSEESTSPAEKEVDTSWVLLVASQEESRKCWSWRLTPREDTIETFRSPDIPLGQANSIDPDNWSQANQFFPAGCDYTPLVPRQQFTSVIVTSNSLGLGGSSPELAICPALG